MSRHRFYVAALLVCACGAANLVFYLLPPGDAFEKRDPVSGNPDTSEHARYSDGSQPSNGSFSFKRKLNNAQSTDTAKQPEGTDSAADGDGYTRLYEFAINNVELCGDAEDKNNSIVIVVVSGIGNFIRRNAIRDTWGSVVKGLGGTILFLVGTSDKFQHEVEKESELYADIVQVNILDSYENLTYKSIAMLQWLTDYCTNSKYYLKADDDTYVNVENVLNESSKQIQSEFFLCHAFYKAPPDRNPNSKWHVPLDQYAEKYFPTYCSGTAYAFSVSIVNKLYLSTLKAIMCWMEDVFITGIAANGLGISHIHNSAFAYDRRKPTGCEFEHALSGHRVTPKEMYIIFAQLTNHEIDCKTQANLVLKKAEDAMDKNAHK